MSLDVYLIGDTPVPVTGSGIFIREAGTTIEITDEEWQRRFPGVTPVRVIKNPDATTTTLYHGNITHNLNRMAEAANIYAQLWRPDECGITLAQSLILPLAAGLNRLRNDPAMYRAYNPENGWGTYEHLVAFVAAYLKACIDHPTARIEVSR
jgi:hypothetical protein